MDFILDYVEETTYWSILFICHALLAVTLLGALTHQAFSVLAPVRRTAGSASFVERFRGVHGAAYATAVCVLWVIAFFFGAWIYTKYRIDIRIPIEEMGYWKTQGFFELKEHVATIGLGLLPAYWYFWKNARRAEFDSVRKGVTVTLTGMCWAIFLIGHTVNNVRGFGS
jgi:hypothetical protein